MSDTPPTPNPNPRGVILRADDVKVGDFVTAHNPSTPFSGPPFQVLAINLPYVYCSALTMDGQPCACTIFDVRAHRLMKVPTRVSRALLALHERLAAPRSPSPASSLAPIVSIMSSPFGGPLTGGPHREDD